MRTAMPVVVAGILLGFAAGFFSAAQEPPATTRDSRQCNVYRLRFAEAEEVVRRARVEESALWQDGVLIADRNRNSVVFRLPQDRVEAAIAQIQRLDQPPADVALECAIVETETTTAGELMKQLLGAAVAPGSGEEDARNFGLNRLIDRDGDGIPDNRICPSRRREVPWGYIPPRVYLASRCAAPTGTDIRGLSHVLEVQHGGRVAWWAPLRFDCLKISHPELSPLFCPATAFELAPKPTVIEPGLWCLDLHLQMVTAGREPSYGTYRGHAHLVPGEVVLCGPLPVAPRDPGALPLSKAEARGKEHPRRFLLVWLRKVPDAGRLPFFLEMRGRFWLPLPPHELNRDDLIEFHSPLRRRFPESGVLLPR